MPTSTTAALHSAPARDRYDSLTIFFHWLTALLVIALFASAQIWGLLAKGTSLRGGLQSVHISLGITLAALIIARLAWRLSQGRRLPRLEGAAGWAAKAGHGLLYVLLVAQATLGFLLRWAQGETFEFFGIFPIPAPVVIDHEMRKFYGGLHENVAWALIILSALHACAALWHHYFLRDGVLLRMKPEQD